MDYLNARLISGKTVLQAIQEQNEKSGEGWKLVAETDDADAMVSLPAAEFYEKMELRRKGFAMIEEQRVAFLEMIEELHGFPAQ
ncbi:hypothetical protein [uncultured Pseudomonas sp.]|uniref:hypothetical protein n=1 Tax=uncultured Pseudomonas sp. TaxID=114707 RepID=UPI0025F741EB|nr:hypothetical protein [uncultured Pseudomonas sp.]